MSAINLELHKKRLNLSATDLEKNMSSVKTISNSEFKSKIENFDKTVLISFLADKSAPSRMIEPSLCAVAKKFAAQADIYKMDTDTNSDTPAAYRIKSVPTLLIFKKG